MCSFPHDVSGPLGTGSSHQRVQNLLDGVKDVVHQTSKHMAQFEDHPAVSQAMSENDELKRHFDNLRRGFQKEQAALHHHLRSFIGEPRPEVTPTGDTASEVEREESVEVCDSQRPPSVEYTVKSQTAVDALDEGKKPQVVSKPELEERTHTTAEGNPKLEERTHTTAEGNPKRKSSMFDGQRPAQMSRSNSLRNTGEQSQVLRRSDVQESHRSRSKSKKTEPPPFNMRPRSELSAPRHFFPAACMEGRVIEGHTQVRLVGPPHPGLDRLVFRKGEPGKHTFVTVGNNCAVARPTQDDVIIDHNLHNLRTLWNLYQHVKNRRQRVFADWKQKNKDCIGRVAPRLDYQRDANLSEAVRQVLVKDVPAAERFALDVVIPVLGKNGGIVSDEEGTISRRRIIVLRWKHTHYIPVPSESEEYRDPVRPWDVLVRKSDDVVIPENEVTLQRLWHLFNWMVWDEHVLSHDEDKPTPAATPHGAKRQSENRPPTPTLGEPSSKKQKKDL